MFSFFFCKKNKLIETDYQKELKSNFLTAYLKKWIKKNKPLRKLKNKIAALPNNQLAVIDNDGIKILNADLKETHSINPPGIGKPYKLSGSNDGFLVSLNFTPSLNPIIAVYNPNDFFKRCGQWRVDSQPQNTNLKAFSDILALENKKIIYHNYHPDSGRIIYLLSFQYFHPTVKTYFYPPSENIIPRISSFSTADNIIGLIYNAASLPKQPKLFYDFLQKRKYFSDTNELNQIVMLNNKQILTFQHKDNNTVCNILSLPKEEKGETTLPLEVTKQFVKEGEQLIFKSLLKNGVVLLQNKKDQLFLSNPLSEKNQLIPVALPEDATNIDAITFEDKLVVSYGTPDPQIAIFQLRNLEKLLTQSNLEKCRLG